MKTFFRALFLIVSLTILPDSLFAWEGMPLPRLHVEGRYLKDPHGNIINLHGYAQTFSPWFNEGGEFWNNYDVAGCLNYNQGIIDGIMDAGWKMNFVRMHMDPYWSSTPGCEGRYEGEECFNFDRFKTYLDEVFIPMAEYAISKGMYVVLRPPGVSPEQIEVGGVYQKYLLRVWGYVAQHPKLKNHPNIMFELANEPINILGSDGTYGSGAQGYFDNLKIYFQEIVDTVRTYADNILWIPGLGYQSQYQGFAVNPIEGENIGYAVHVYPGWFNSGDGYENFQNGWDNQVKPVADFAPIIVTEMDWAPEKYESSWGKGITGTAGGEGFGANFKKITDDSGNVSWLLFTEPHFLADFSDTPPADGEDFTFLNDPEACPWPIYHWYEEYAPDYTPVAEFSYQYSPDNGDGTFSNPILYGDFPTPKVVRDGSTYFMISNSISSGNTVLESKDLVNWQYSSVLPEEVSMENLMMVDDQDESAGSLIETQEGDWWVIRSSATGPFGQFPQLLPVTWENEIPIIDESKINESSVDKPEVGRDYFTESLATNDPFRYYNLKNQWEWTDGTSSEGWSLLDRAGYMRLKNQSVITEIEEAEMLTQRMLAFPSDFDNSFGTIKLDISNMNEGDVAGLSVFQDSRHFVGIQLNGGIAQFIAETNNQTQVGPEVQGTEVYLRAVASYNSGTLNFYYSLDNQTYTSLGNEVELQSGNQAARIGLFSYATSEIGGYVDIDWFSTESSFEENSIYPESFENFTEESLTVTELVVGTSQDMTVLTGGNTKLTIEAVFADGHSEDVSREVSFLNSNPEVLSISAGYILSKMDGTSSLTVSYTGPLGDEMEETIEITSSTFPLTDELFDPGIWENGTFDEETQTLQTGQYGFGGWSYEGIDMSDYKYLVVRLGSDNNSSVDFRLFDGSSYWGSPASYSFGSGREVVINFKDATKNDGTPLNNDHIYIAGFWSTGSNPFVIDTVFLSNSREYDPDPEMGTSTNSLTKFSYPIGEGPSGNQWFNVFGDYLLGDIQLEAPDGFEISFSAQEGYMTSLTVSHYEGEVLPTKIYSRLKEGLEVGIYEGAISITSDQVSEQSVLITGEVGNPLSASVGIPPKLIDTMYFTLSGRQLNPLLNHTGLYLEKKFFADGTTKTTKVFIVRD